MKRAIERLEKAGIYCNNYSERVPGMDNTKGYRLLLGTGERYYLICGGKYIAKWFGHGCNSEPTTEFLNRRKKKC